MICPNCENGMVLILRGQNKKEMRPIRGGTFLTNPEKYFDKVPCQRCNGSGLANCCDGEDVEFDPATGQGDCSGAGEDRPLVKSG